jgi:ketosteroid isomerase-like protein
MKSVLLVAVLVSIPYGSAEPQTRDGAVSDASFRKFLAQWEVAQARFINGDPTMWKQHASHTEDATIFGAFGGHEKGWKEVGERNDWASSQFTEGGTKKPFEYLNSASSGDLAFTVAIERDEVLVRGQRKPVARALRVTQIFRKDGGVWRLLHRHADPLIERKAPPAAPQR